MDGLIMKLYLLRHAIAEDRKDGRDHPDRRLTPEGIAQSRKIGKFCEKNNLRFNRILSSPFQRALQTAETLSSKLKRPPAIEIADWLHMEMPISLALPALCERSSEHKSLLLVGHEPDLSRLIVTLLGIPDASKVKIRKGSLTLISTTGQGLATCQLRWSIIPELL
jgi:phosphohistidine phosphatase